MGFHLRSRRLVFVITPVLSISDIHLREVCDVAQKDIDFDGEVQTRARFLKYCLQVCDTLVLSVLLAMCREALFQDSS